jgi:hypothetical protein
MSDIQLKSEVTLLIDSSGYSKSKDMICPITRILSMRHKNVPLKQIYKVAKSVF